MPVINTNTPTVSVNVPVPVPVPQPKKSRTPVSFGPPPQAPQPPAPARPAPQPQQPVPGPRAIIFPWSPSPGGKRQMRRLPARVVRYAADHSQVAHMLNTLAGPDHAATRAGDPSNDAQTFRGVLADALQDHGREEEADHLRGKGRVFVQDGQVRPLPSNIEVYGRRWFQRGNTYHSVHVYLDGKHALHVPYEYGYGSQYLQTAMDGLQERGLLPGRDHPDGGNYLGSSWARRMGVNLIHEAEDVRRKRDLSEPPPPSRYVPPAAPEQLSRTNYNRPRRYGRLRTVGEYGGITKSFIDAIDQPQPYDPNRTYRDSAHYDHPLILADFLQDEDDPRALVIRRAHERDLPHMANDDAGEIGYDRVREHDYSDPEHGDITLRAIQKGKDKGTRKLVANVHFPSPAHQYRGISRNALVSPEEARSMIDAIPHEGERTAAHAFIDKHFGPRPVEPTPMSRNRSTLPKKVVRFSADDSLPGLLRAARQNPHEATLHGAIADALDEAHPGNHVAELIRRQYGLGQHAGNGPREVVHHYPFGTRSSELTLHGTAPIGDDGPFDLSLGHEAEHRSTGAEYPTSMHRWVVHAVSRLPGSQETGYSFEFPHSEAWTIPDMFPGASAHIHSSPVRGSMTHGSPEAYRDHEAQIFNDRMNGAG